MPGLKKPSSASGNTADYSTFCLSESLSVSVRTKPRTFSSSPPSLPVQCHVHTPRLKKKRGSDELLTPETNPAAFEDARSYLVFVITSFTFRDAESRSQTTAFDWLMLKYQLVLCCEGGGGIQRSLISSGKSSRSSGREKAHQISSHHLNLSAGPAGPNR